jgi:hypothetical protein|tara:strand:- start:76 stop:264 length:189 start_codon:yes stop_codon:yes gene_type:complete
MDNNLIEVKNDFKRQFETVQEEIVDLERELNKKKEHFLKLQGGLETLSILEQKMSTSINIDE